MVTLYQFNKSNISEHIKYILEEKELEENSTVRKFRTVENNGKDYNLEKNIELEVIMIQTYWSIGNRIIEEEQGGNLKIYMDNFYLYYTFVKTYCDCLFNGYW